MVFSLSMVALTANRNANHAQATRKWRCNQYGHSIQVWDDSVTPSGATIDSINDSEFKSFVESVSTYLGQKFPVTNACPKDGQHPSTISLTFVRLPLVTSEEAPLALPPQLPSTAPPDACRLESPWLKLAFRRAEQPHLLAVFIWNERQFLMDQYLRSQKTPQKMYDLTPLPSSLFHRYASDYGEPEVTSQQPHIFRQPPVAKPIPADILWLFHTSPHTTFIPFSESARATMKSMLKSNSKTHLHLVKLLVNQCIESKPGSYIHHQTILDLKDDGT